MTDINIPREAVEAMARNRAIRNEDDDRYWPDYADGVEADLRAGLKAWPGMKHDGPSGWGVSQEPLQPSRLILPLPTSLQKMQTTQSGDAGDD